MTPKDWSTQEEAIAAAKAEILAAIGSADARLELGMVKSVQRGKFSTTSYLRTIAISEVDPAKTIVLLQNMALPSVSRFGLAELKAKSFTVSIYSDSTSNSGSSNIAMHISWQVIEFY